MPRGPSRIVNDDDNDNDDNGIIRSQEKNSNPNRDSILGPPDFQPGPLPLELSWFSYQPKAQIMSLSSIDNGNNDNSDDDDDKLKSQSLRWG